LWAFSIQRTIQEGPFDPKDKILLGTLSSTLTEAATLSIAVGRAVIAGMTDTLDIIAQPALVVDRMGYALGSNSAADRLFDDDIRISNRRLVVRDRNAQTDLDALTARMRAMPDIENLAARPILVRRGGRAPLLIQVLSLPAAARSPFLGARALFTFADFERTPTYDVGLLRRIFGLTSAEARLASLVGVGLSPNAAAAQIGISHETARSQLKAIFGKTETHRQAELVALLSRLGV
jgi:DNA-binding CsgD family transcriptional regulator